MADFESIKQVLENGELLEVRSTPFRPLKSTENLQEKDAKAIESTIASMIRAELDRHEEKQSRFGVLLAIAIFLAASAIGFAVGLLF